MMLLQRKKRRTDFKYLSRSKVGVVLGDCHQKLIINHSGLAQSPCVHQTSLPWKNKISFILLMVTFGYLSQTENTTVGKHATLQHLGWSCCAISMFISYQEFVEIFQNRATGNSAETLAVTSTKHEWQHNSWANIFFCAYWSSVLSLSNARTTHWFCRDFANWDGLHEFTSLRCEIVCFFSRKHVNKLAGCKKLHSYTSRNVHTEFHAEM